MSEENEVIENEYEADSLESALAEAWDNTENSEETNEYESNETSIAAPRSEAEGSSPASTDEKDDQDAIRSAENQDEQPVESDDEYKLAPVGLSVEAKQEWANTPKDVQKHIMQFEKRMENVSQKYGKQAQRADAMDRSLAPFSQLMAMNGGAANVLPGLLQTASQLQMGSNQQKAFAVASIIKQYDIDIKALDSMLVGEAPSQADQQKELIQQQIQQQMAPMQQHYQQQQQQQQYYQQQEQQRIGGEVSNFGQNNEFYEYVSLDMADKLDQAAAQGIQMTMDQAYDSACWGNEKIRKILQDRQTTQNVATRKVANSSIQGTSGGTMSSGAPNSVEAALNEAWDNAGRM
jgi:hypothetical protein